MFMFMLGDDGLLDFIEPKMIRLDWIHFQWNKRRELHCNRFSHFLIVAFAFAMRRWHSSIFFRFLSSLLRNEMTRKKKEVEPKWFFSCAWVLFSTSSLVLFPLCSYSFQFFYCGYRNEVRQFFFRDDRTSLMINCVALDKKLFRIPSILTTESRLRTWYVSLAFCSTFLWLFFFFHFILLFDALSAQINSLPKLKRTNHENIFTKIRWKRNFFSFQFVFLALIFISHSGVFFFFVIYTHFLFVL